MTLVFLAALGAVVVGFILYPVFHGGAGDARRSDETARELSRLAEKKERILSGIKDLDFEHKAGKLSDADYQKVRADDLAEVADIISRMDELAGRSAARTAPPPPAPAEPQVTDGRVETGPTCASCQQTNPPGAAFCYRCGSRIPTSVKCPRCGIELPLEARFCTGCGAAVRE